MTDDILRMVRSIEGGDFTVVPALVDALREMNDPRWLEVANIVGRICMTPKFWEDKNRVAGSMVLYAAEEISQLFCLELLMSEGVGVLSAAMKRLSDLAEMATLAPSTPIEPEAEHTFSTDLPADVIQQRQLNQQIWEMRNDLSPDREDP